jgi:hypothetical protein
LLIADAPLKKAQRVSVLKHFTVIESLLTEVNSQAESIKYFLSLFDIPKEGTPEAEL